MRKVAKIPLLLVLFTVLVTSILVYESSNYNYKDIYNSVNLNHSANNKNNIAHKKKSYNSISFQIKDAELIINNDLGLKKAKIIAHKIEHIPSQQENITKIYQPDVTLDTSQNNLNNNTLHITSINGQINHENYNIKEISEIILQDNVVSHYRINNNTVQKPQSELDKYNFNITSNKLIINYNNNYAVYKQNVKLYQADKKIDADNIYIYFNNNLNDKIKDKIKNGQNETSKNHIKIIKAVADTNLVTLSSKLSNNKTINAKAKIIEFDPHDNKIKLEKNVIIEQDGKTLTSELVYFDIEKEMAYLPKSGNNNRSKITLG